MEKKREEERKKREKELQKKKVEMQEVREGIKVKITQERKLYE